MTRVPETSFNNMHGKLEDLKTDDSNKYFTSPPNALGTVDEPYPKRTWHITTTANFKGADRHLRGSSKLKPAHICSIKNFKQSYNKPFWILISRLGYIFYIFPSPWGGKEREKRRKNRWNQLIKEEIRQNPTLWGKILFWKKGGGKVWFFWGKYTPVGT